MAKEKRTPHKVVMTEGKREIIRGLLSEYDIQSAQDIQEALKDLLGGTIKEMMEAEMENHLGYEKSTTRNVAVKKKIELFTEFYLLVKHYCFIYSTIFSFPFSNLSRTTCISLVVNFKHFFFKNSGTP